MTTVSVYNGDGTPGNWSDPANWEGGFGPGPTALALVENDSIQTVGGIVSVNAVMVLDDSTVTFTDSLFTAGVGTCQGVMACDGGTINFAPGSTLTDGGAVLSGLDDVGTINVTGTSAQATTLNSATGDLGEDAPASGTINISDATWAVGINLVVGDFGSGTLNIANASMVSVGVAFAIGAKAGGTGQTTLSSGSTLSVGGGAAIGSGVGTGTLTVDATAAFTVQNGMYIAAASTLDLLGGAVSINGAVAIAAGGVVTGHGTLAMGAFGIGDNGVIQATGGTLQISGNVTGSGALLIGQNSTVAITSASLLMPTLTFSGANSTLILAPGINVTGTLDGFTYGDEIDMAGVSSVSWNSTTNALNLDNAGGAKIAQLHIAGGASDLFAVTQSNGMGVITLLSHTS
jgi:T5SS/PEP-CTERM-associated repeat protein